MIDYIQHNKEWIFSGVGVAIAGAIVALVRNLILKKRLKSREQPSSAAKPAIQKMTNPARNLTVESIVHEINSAPLFQRDVVAENFKGIHVKWEGTMADIQKPLFRHPGGTDADVEVEVRTAESLHSIRFTVTVDKYPRLKVLKRGERIGVSGTIKKCSGPGLYVELEVAKITFPK